MGCITKIWASNFRNISEINVSCANRFGICGDNGNGKSNFLEIIYVSIYGKSFREARLEDMLSFYSKKFLTGLDMRGSTGDARLYFSFDQEKGKSNEISGAYKNTTALKRDIPVSYFSSDIVRLLTENPETRRKELDRFCKLYFPDSVQFYSRYDLVLRQKNKALSQQDIESAEIFHEQLSLLAVKIFEFRNKGLFCLSEKLSDYASFFGLPKVEAKYLIRGEYLKGEYDTQMKMHFNKNKGAELAAGFSLFGPHRDDFSLFIGEKEAEKFYSRGINKIMAILFRLSGYVSLSSKVELPILLLDDVFSEIDTKNRNIVLSLLTGYPQIFFTFLTKEKLDIPWFRVENGLFKEI